VNMLPSSRGMPEFAGAHWVGRGGGQEASYTNSVCRFSPMDRKNP
jgi:hypothetical protein